MQDLVGEPWLLTLLAGVGLVAGATMRLLLVRGQAPPPSGAPSGPGAAVAALADAASRGEHWLSDVGRSARLEVEHVREFYQSPDTVFAALVQVLAVEGHIEGIEGYGTVVVFSPQRCRMSPGRSMRARVHRRSGRTVLDVSSEAPPPATLADRQSECVQIHHLLNLLAHRLHGSSRVSRASALVHS